MKRIRYIRELEVEIEGDCCVHLEEGTLLSGCGTDAEVWLEAYVPERVIAAAERLRHPVLNSLWLDERYWEAYGPRLGTFASFVLMPYDPQSQEQQYERNVVRLLELADRYAIPAGARIIDLAVLPYGRQPDVSIYRNRLDRLHEQELRTVAAFDNYIHRAAGKRRLIEELHEALENKLTYALIRSRYEDYLPRTSMYPPD